MVKIAALAAGLPLPAYAVLISAALTVLREIVVFVISVRGTDSRDRAEVIRALTNRFRPWSR